MVKSAVKQLNRMRIATNSFFFFSFFFPPSFMATTELFRCLLPEEVYLEGDWQHQQCSPVSGSGLIPGHGSGGREVPCVLLVTHPLPPATGTAAAARPCASAPHVADSTARGPATGPVLGQLAVISCTELMCCSTVLVTGWCSHPVHAMGCADPLISIVVIHRNSPDSWPPAFVHVQTAKMDSEQTTNKQVRGNIAFTYVVT